MDFVSSPREGWCQSLPTLRRAPDQDEMVTVSVYPSSRARATTGEPLQVATAAARLAVVMAENASTLCRAAGVVDVG